MGFSKFQNSKVYLASKLAAKLSDFFTYGGKNEEI